MSGWAFDDEAAASLAAQVSGVHEAPTEPAPYIDDFDVHASLIGSIPRNALTAEFEPIVRLADGRTLGFEAVPHCHADGLTDNEQLYARATFEKTVGELGRAIREIALRECGGSAVYLRVHPNELKDSWLVRPDDPVCFHDGEIFLQLNQAVIAGLPLQVVRELGGRSGISLLIDDFGTGPATLRQIVELEPAAVKVGRELTAGIGASWRKQKTLARVVELCADLGALLIAKGVESPKEVEIIRACGVHAAQGIAVGEPCALPSIPVWPATK
jgi:EAL domain-containing protein (putative c-di-GMP-specific phosphodiesterase class I)